MSGYFRSSPVVLDWKSASFLRWCYAFFCVVGFVGRAVGQNESSQPGQFFRVEQPITSDSVDRLTGAARSYLRDASATGLNPVLVFEIGPGSSPYGVSYELANTISRRLGGARKTVAFVPEPLEGYGALVALACDEIVFGPQAYLGPIGSRSERPDPSQVSFAESLAEAQGRPPALLVGMLNPSTDLLRVRRGDGQSDLVLEEDLPEYRQRHEVVSTSPLWGAGSRGQLSADLGRELGVVRLIVEDRLQLARAYQLDSVASDPTLGTDALEAVWVSLQGTIDRSDESYLRRQLALAQQQNVNVLFLELDSPGGELRYADDIADRISKLDDIKTVAFVRDRALGAAALIAIACDEIVFHRDGVLGNIENVVVGDDDQADLPDRDRTVLSDRLTILARENGYAPAVARSLVEPQMTIYAAVDRQTGAEILVSEEELQADNERFDQPREIKAPGSLLTITAQNAERFGMSQLVVDDDEELKALYGLAGRSIRVNGPSWVDGLVTALNTPVVSGLLLFIGFFMLVVEMKLPGIGLPAITATLAFLLFFWSRYLGGTADGLEIILFVVGLICLALELFVFPGFGVFGMSGVLLVLLSVVMASHTFIWPTKGSQYQQMGQTLLQLVLTLVGVFAGAVLLGRFFPSLPLFNKLILRPELDVGFTDDPVAKPPLDPNAPLAFLLGESGRTTSVLRPSGKARIGELLVDVTADGFYIERDCPVQVVDVQGNRVIVKKL